MNIKGVFIIICLSLSLQAIGQDLYNIDTVRTGYLTFYDSNWQSILDSFKTNDLEDRVLADLSVDGIFLDSVGVRFKGNSSYNSGFVKKPFNIDLDYTKNQDLYGFTKLKLNNMFKDPSCVREVLSYEMLRNYMPASEANFMQLYIDGNLHGLYTSVQSVNDDFNLDHLGSDNSSFFKCDPIFGAPPIGGCPGGPGQAALVDKGPDTACYKTSYDIKSDSGWLELVNLIQILNNNVSQIEQVLNVDRALWMLAFNNILVNFDSYTGSGHNYYVYENEYGRFNTIIWDLNECFGVFKSGGGQPPTNLSVAQMQNLSPLWNDQSNAHPLIKQLLADADYKKRYMAHFRTIMEEFLANNSMKNRASQIQTIIDAFVSADPNSNYGYMAFQDGLDQSPYNIVGVNVLMDARYSYLTTNAEVVKAGPTISSVQQSNTSPTAMDSVWVTASTNGTQAWLHYKTAEHAPFDKEQMYDDGMHGDGASGDGVYGALIPAQSPATTVYYYIYADNNSAGMFSPVRAEYEFYSYTVEGVQLAAGDLVINEFMASNSSAVADQDGEFDDWIELYNNTSSDISLHNMFLADDLTDPLDWCFPDTTIGANDFIIVWADNDAQTGLHASFKLSSLGEDVVLSNSDGSLLDSISFSQQITDLTTGRYPNGTGSFQTLLPTFSAANSVLSTKDLSDGPPGFVVYPNPASDILTVTFDNGALGYEGVMEIYNMLLQKINALPVQNDKEFTISTTNLSDGIYFLKLQDHVQKVVIAR